MWKSLPTSASIIARQLVDSKFFVQPDFLAGYLAFIWFKMTRHFSETLLRRSLLGISLSLDSPREDGWVQVKQAVPRIWRHESSGPEVPQNNSAQIWIKWEISFMSSDAQICELWSCLYINVTFLLLQLFCASAEALMEEPQATTCRHSSAVWGAINQ